MRQRKARKSIKSKSISSSKSSSSRNNRPLMPKKTVSFLPSDLLIPCLTDISARVTIVGQPEAQWKAQFCIYDKLKQEGWFGSEEGRLTSQITIPGVLVGRVIGKGGVNVRELQVEHVLFLSFIF